jgi:hypothetical protein
VIFEFIQGVGGAFARSDKNPAASGAIGADFSRSPQDVSEYEFRPAGARQAKV